MSICICSKCRTHSSTSSRERRKGRRSMTPTRRLTDLKYIFSLFLTKRYKGNMSKCQNVLNLDYGYMVVSFIFFSAHFWKFHIFHKDKNLKIVFLLPLKSLGYDKPSNPRVFRWFVWSPIWDSQTQELQGSVPTSSVLQVALDPLPLITRGLS